MGKISNKIKSELMNRLYENKDISDIVQEYNISNKTIENCINELQSITKNNTLEIVKNQSFALSNEDIIKEKNKFRKYSWQIIQKANQILIDKLNQLSNREKEIDRILSKIEDCLIEENYDKTQMGKLIKLLENTKQNNLSELARVIQILYDKQENIISDNGQDTETLESMLEDLMGDSF